MPKKSESPLQNFAARNTPLGGVERNTWALLSLGIVLAVSTADEIQECSKSYAKQSCRSGKHGHDAQANGVGIGSIQYSYDSYGDQRATTNSPYDQAKPY